jgi:DNA phosphorothioation-dependent restriction protein DptG
MTDTTNVVMVEKYFSHLTFDINTVPSASVRFEEAELRRIFPELVRLAKENISSGEVVPT